jgi:hypothetical protein
MTRVVHSADSGEQVIRPLGDRMALKEVGAPASSRGVRSFDRLFRRDVA